MSHHYKTGFNTAFFITTFFVSLEEWSIFLDSFEMAAFSSKCFMSQHKKSEYNFLRGKNSIAKTLLFVK